MGFILQSAKDIGISSENIACSFLEDNGYRILVRNFRVRMGEIDIICKKGNTLVAVEVKTIPEKWPSYDICDMVDSFKLTKIQSAFALFIANEKGLNYDEIRTDVISVTRKGQVTHYKGVQ